MKLAIGTAQFGMSYGITNTFDKPSVRECYDILAMAGRHGIKMIDTAAAYGDSESILAQVLPDLPYGFSVNTKISAKDLQQGGGLAQSKLTQSEAVNLHSLMVHDPWNLENRGWQTLSEQNSQRPSARRLKLGCSVYAPEDTQALLARSDLNVVQIPLSLLDQRFCKQQTITTLHDCGVEIHARSLFLQGTILAEVAELPASLRPYRRWFEAMDAMTKHLGIRRLELAMALVHQIPHISYFVVGIAHRTQLTEILEAYESSQSLQFDWHSLSCDEAQLINPAMWP